ncbi:hypothetical protein D9758_016666 [Tetrapyrgos nigripes]|uniref:Uncharacterized protein n=1 Tax=Tetrapyrgos nigripes TaxID=182062 RepID=A0A8H5C9E1_9AGAR|nr:hypothetical protein D9758_016666 [Tetrapyrgos nigripes]
MSDRSMITPSSFFSPSHLPEGPSTASVSTRMPGQTRSMGMESIDEDNPMLTDTVKANQVPTRPSFFKEPSVDLRDTLSKQRKASLVPFTRSPFTDASSSDPIFEPEELLVSPAEIPWSDLLLEIAMTTAFASLTDGTPTFMEATNVWSYLSFFALVWWVWASQVAYNVRFRQSDWLHRAFIPFQVFVFCALAAFTSDFDITNGISDKSKADQQVERFEQARPFTSVTKPSQDVQKFRENRLPTLNMRGIAMTMAWSRFLLLVQYFVVIVVLDHFDSESFPIQDLLIAKLDAFYDLDPNNLTWVNNATFSDIMEEVLISNAMPTLWFYAAGGSVLVALGLMGLIRQWPRFGDWCERGQTISRLLMGSAIILVTAIDANSSASVFNIDDLHYEGSRIWHLATHSWVLPIYTFALLTEQVIELLLLYLAGRKLSDFGASTFFRASTASGYARTGTSELDHFVYEEGERRERGGGESELGKCQEERGDTSKEKKSERSIAGQVIETRG